MKRPLKAARDKLFERTKDLLESWEKEFPDYHIESVLQT